MNRPTVSVVIPVKDDAEKLRHCLEALAGQQVAPLEIIVVDNGSSDDSAGVARGNGAQVLFEPRPGIGVASAAGYHRARGDILARLDADSVPAPDWIATIVASFHADAGVDAITGPAHFNDGPSALRRPALWAYLLPYFALSSLALGHVPLFGSNMAFRRRAWHEVSDHLHTDRWLVHDDFDLSFHLGVEHVLRFVPTLRTGISMRPFHDGGAVLRLRRGFHTVFLHWPHDLPWLRITRRLRTRFRRPAHRGQYDGGAPGNPASWDDQDMDLQVSPVLTIPASELGWRFSRASGPGGQHVNKTDSRVELFWNIAASPTLGEEDRELLVDRLGSRLVAGTLTVTSSEQRSQRRNRERALEKLAQLIREALAPAGPKRRPTKPTRGSKRRHRAAKKQRSDVKQQRRRPSAE